MPSPSTSILDNFNRADGALGSSWTAKIDDTTVGPPVIASNVAVPRSGNGYSDAYWNATTYGLVQEAFLTVTGLPGAELDIIFKAQNPGTSTAKFYEWTMNSNTTWEIWRCVTGHSYTSLGTQNYNTAKAAGQSFWVTASEVAGVVTITAYQNTGGGYAQMGSPVVDSSGLVLGAGYIGFAVSGAGAAIDDFGGGTVGGAVVYPPPFVVPFYSALVRV
jgi:hypothetical protein